MTNGPLWTPDLSVGNDAIDDDHKGLFNLIASLDDADMSRTYINSILDQLKRYTEGHFSREEQHMKKIGYPHMAEHLEQHKQFVEWLKTIRKMYAHFPQSPYVVGDSVNSYLNRWLKEHILQEDMKYRDFLIGNGIEPEH